MTAEQLARDVKMLVCDVDGVFTDGGLYYDESGRVSKRFDVQDGFGVKLAQRMGLEVAVITGLESEAVRLRILELGIREYHAGHRQKKAVVDDICRRNELDYSRLAYLGDDWVDAVPLSLVGLPMAVANAQEEIKNLAAWVSSCPGGKGAVRDAVRFILQAQGNLKQAWKLWSFSDDSA
jgi:3-deoxy-D-manno-octulosonate 8-phosphate phosphatase (KDO 8-P phosphatase)